jgi:hypothetical protein
MKEKFKKRIFVKSFWWFSCNPKGRKDEEENEMK